MDVGAEFPQLAGGTDGSLQDAACDVAFDIEDPLPAIPSPSQLLPNFPPVPVLPKAVPSLPPIGFIPPAACLQSSSGDASCGHRLDCRLPFCGRDIIFVHGLITDELEDLLVAKHSSSTNPALAVWPQNASAFTSPSGYFRTAAEKQWSRFIVRKLGAAYKNAQVGYGPRFLVIAWPATQRMEYGIHAAVYQIAAAIQTGARVQTLDMSGSPTAKAIPYFLDQNVEALRRPAAHAAAPNPFLAPNGMILKSVSLNEIPGGSAGLPEVFSFLQSTAPHLFLLDVGSGGDSQPNDAGDGCPPGTFSYRPTGNYFGAEAAVAEESRAVFDASVYTTRSRNHFAAVEAGTGAIPLLSPALGSAVEGEVKGRYLKIRFKIGKKILYEKIFWIWKREYLRMTGWRCDDEIDYSLRYAFRR
jgi:hypothetical protein